MCGGDGDGGNVWGNVCSGGFFYPVVELFCKLGVKWVDGCGDCGDMSLYG